MGLIDNAGYKLDPEAFEQITKGIKAATAELKELGFDIEAQTGRGFDELALDSVECGDDSVSSALESFCDRWGWGVRAMMQDANEFSRRLGLSAGIYFEEEQYLSGTLKQTVNAAMGDLSLSPEQVKKQTWSEIGSDNPLTQFRDADWDPTSQASMEAAGRVAEQGQQLGHDFTSIPDRFENGGEDPADKDVKLGSLKPRHADGSNEK